MWKTFHISGQETALVEWRKLCYRCAGQATFGWAIPECIAFQCNWVPLLNISNWIIVVRTQRKRSAIWFKMNSWKVLIWWWWQRDVRLVWVSPSDDIIRKGETVLMNKFVKKILALVLAVVMMMAMSTVAMAATTNDTATTFAKDTAVYDTNGFTEVTFKVLAERQERSCN